MEEIRIEKGIARAYNEYLKEMKKNFFAEIKLNEEEDEYVRTIWYDEDTMMDVCKNVHKRVFG